MQPVPQPIALYREAARGFRAVLAKVRPSQLAHPTPCDKWSVRALILLHNIKVQAILREVFEGKVTTDDTDVGGPLPNEGVRRALQVVERPGALERALDTPLGRMTGGQFVMGPFMDLLTHRWDPREGNCPERHPRAPSCAGGPLPRGPYPGGGAGRGRLRACGDASGQRKPAGPVDRQHRAQAVAAR